MISINFAGGNYRVIDLLRKIFAFVIVLLVLGAGTLIWNGVSLRARVAGLNRSIKQIEAAEEQFRPLLAERGRIIKDLNAMSGLMESRRFSWTRLLTSVENIFPVGVALSKIEYSPRDRAVALDGAARSPESLTNLMVAMEKTPLFRDPYLKHQSVDKGSIFFNVVAFYQEHAAAAVAEGK